MNADQEIASIAVAALERIARKPWVHHRAHREFQDAGGNVRTVLPGHCTLKEWQDPSWKPAWAKAEHNACDCPYCVSVRALREIKELPVEVSCRQD